MSKEPALVLLSFEWSILFRVYSLNICHIKCYQEKYIHRIYIYICVCVCVYIYVYICIDSLSSNTIHDADVIAL